MKSFITVLGLILIGALGTVGYLYSQDDGAARLTAWYNQGLEKASDLVPALNRFKKTEPSQPAVETTGVGSNTAANAEQMQPLSVATASGQASDADGPLRFGMPIECVVGRNCLIQSFVDTDPGPAAADYRCGSLSADRAQGTKIRLPSVQEMQAGVNVLAAAQGEVIRVRDGLPDVDYRLVGREAVGKSSLGNVVLLRHRDGYITAYGQLKNNSITVKIGEQVNAGQTLGQVGLSGISEYPHLHFEVRKDRKVIDPFTGRERGAGCEDPAADAAIFTQAALKQLTYHSTAVLRIGFAETTLNDAAVEYGMLMLDGSSIQKMSDLMLHVSVSGSQAGDIARLEIFDPAGRQMTSSTETLETGAAVRLLIAGSENTAESLDSGRYSGVFTLTRFEEGTPKSVISAQTSITVE